MFLRKFFDDRNFNFLIQSSFSRNLLRTKRFPDGRTDSGGERFNKSDVAPKRKRSGQRRKSLCHGPFLGREWPGNSRPAHLLKQFEGQICRLHGRSRAVPDDIGGSQRGDYPRPDQTRYLHKNLEPENIFVL